MVVEHSFLDIYDLEHDERLSHGSESQGIYEDACNAQVT